MTSFSVTIPTSLEPFSTGSAPIFRRAINAAASESAVVGATVMTPFNLAFWGSRYGPTSRLLREVSLDPLQMATTVLVILGLPVVSGMILAARRPDWARRLRRPLGIFSFLAFAGFIAAALLANVGPMREHLGAIAGLVALHNALALALGYGAARVVGLPEADSRAVSIEIGIQNSALGLVLIFDFFAGLGGMALVAAWWGVWHLIAGMAVATFWSRRPIAARGSLAPGAAP